MVKMVKMVEMGEMERMADLEQRATKGNQEKQAIRASQVQMDDQEREVSQGRLV